MLRTTLTMALLLLIAVPPNADARKKRKKNTAVTVLVLDVNRSEGIDLMTANEQVRGRHFTRAKKGQSCSWPTRGDGLITTKRGEPIRTFAELLAFDTNADGKIQPSETSIRIWVDANADGKAQKKELALPASVGLSEIKPPPGTSKTGVARFRDGFSGHVMEIDLCQAK